MSNILEVSGLCKRYAAFEMRDVSFQVPQGYIMGFIGPNGAGKTTTIKLILGAISADSGSIRAPAPEDIGVVMDTPLYSDDWTLGQVEAALAPFYTRWDSRAFAGHIRRFGLDAGKKLKELSRGMKIKLQIAAALSHSPQLLILDEPTSGLDPVARDEICDLLRDFVTDAGKSVFFSTHITSDLDKTADYITFILNGRIVFTGEREALLAKYLRVTGGPGALGGEQHVPIMGYRAHATGFEGMVAASEAHRLPPGVLTEPITLDEIIICMNKGEAIYE